MEADRKALAERLEARIRMRLDTITELVGGACEELCGECPSCLAQSIKVPLQQLRRAAATALREEGEHEQGYWFQALQNAYVEGFLEGQGQATGHTHLSPWRPLERQQVIDNEWPWSDAFEEATGPPPYRG